MVAERIAEQNELVLHDDDEMQKETFPSTRNLLAFTVCKLDWIVMAGMKWILDSTGNSFALEY